MSKIADIRKGKVGEIVAALPSLTVSELRELREAERAESAPSPGVLKGIEQELDQRAADAETHATKAAGSSVATRDGIPAWQKPDYAGALDTAQADWRNRNLKPGTTEATKPAKQGDTK